MGKHGQYGPLVAFCALIQAGSVGAECRLALALGLDVSRSVSAADYEVERQGLVAALRDPEVRAAFFQPGGFVAVAVYEWSGKRYQDLVVPWMAIQRPEDLDRLVAVVSGRQRLSLQLPTGIGEALSYGRRMFANVPYCPAYKLDIAGDGQNDDGREPAWVYRDEDFSSIVVNGLPIGVHEDSLTEYYRHNIIHGPGAFVEPAASVAEYPAALRKKLLRELSEQLLGALAPARQRGF